MGVSAKEKQAAVKNKFGTYWVVQYWDGVRQGYLVAGVFQLYKSTGFYLCCSLMAG